MRREGVGLNMWESIQELSWEAWTPALACFLLLSVINPKGLLCLHCSISAWQPVNSTGMVLCHVVGLGLDFCAVV